MLLLARDTAAKSNLELVLRAPQGNVKSLLELGRFETIFNVAVIMVTSCNPLRFVVSSRGACAAFGIESPRLSSRAWCLFPRVPKRPGFSGIFPNPWRSRRSPSRRTASGAGPGLQSNPLFVCIWRMPASACQFLPLTCVRIPSSERLSAISPFRQVNALQPLIL